MSELGKPKEFSGARARPQFRASKGVVTVALAIVVLVAVLLVVSGCMPNPNP
ncbi:hypothetical protein [Neoaquamicrobium microcysteis]|jgi:uncharacterized membrane protein affecting hemolysin expression|uniref:hypothetical protein n=1 Tax=Neoaquamicrobium microcysteis TaxID=2682781 RepID=UPI001375CB6D|nr:hypothetical protein [Mesorhizobium microcysteis]